MSLSLIIMVMPLMIFCWLLTNKGNLLIMILILEAMNIAMMPLIMLYWNKNFFSSMMIFFIITILVCEACMGLAALISTVRLKNNSMSNAKFFMN